MVGENFQKKEKIGTFFARERERRRDLVVALGGGEVEWGVKATKSGIPSEAGVELQQHPGLHQIAVPGRRDQSLAGCRTSQRVPHRIPDADSISAVQAVTHYLPRPRQRGFIARGLALEVTACGKGAAANRRWGG